MDQSLPGSLLQRVLKSAVSLFLLAALVSPQMLLGQVSGISYTLSPSADYVFFDQDHEAGLPAGYMFGGELGLGFGEYLEVSGEYMFGGDFSTNFDTDTDDPDLQALAEFDGRNVDIHRYGARLRLNLGAGGLTPFVTAGSGLLQFDPQDLETTESIYAILGAGLTYTAAGRFSISLAGQGLGYRYNPGTTFFTEDELQQADLTAGTGQRAVMVPSLRASVALHLGGRAPGEITELDRALMQQFGPNGTGVRLFVEPFYGRINFNPALGFPRDQNIAGTNVGLELGPYVGLRGFYWRGATGEEGPFDDFAQGFESIAFYGGELNLRFGAPFGRRAFTPYGIIGGGYMDVLEGYQDDIPPATMPPDDRFFATVGGGVEFALTPNIKLQGDVRSLLMSTEDPADIASPDNVYGSWMYSAGLEFNFGGRRAPAPDPLVAEPRRPESAVQEEMRRMRQRLAELEELAAEQDLTTEERRIAELRRELDRAEREREVGLPPRPERPEAPVRRSNLSDETITLPIPEVGEIYIRVGEAGVDGQVAQQAGQLTPDAIRALVRDAVQTELARADVDGRVMTADQIRQIVEETLQQEMQAADFTAGDVTLRQLEQRLAEEAAERRAIERELNQLRRQLAEGRVRAPDVIVERDDGRTIVRERQPGLLGGHHLQGISPYSGLRFGDGPTQLMLAVRGDFRRPGGAIRLLPEVGIGVGGGRSINVIGTAAVSLGRFFRLYEPYVGAGAGIITNDGLSGLRPGVNLMAGIEYPTGPGMVFGEFSTFNFLNTNRFAAGYRLRF